MERHEAIVLRRRSIREHDRLITLFGPALGKRDVLARGSRKLLSKLACNLEPFSHLLVELVPGRQYPHLTGAVLLEPFSRLRQRLAAIAQAGFVVDVAESLTRPNAAEPRLFRLVLNELRRLERSSTDRAQPQDVFALALYVLRVVTVAGWQPNFESCSVCHRAFGDQLSVFSAHPFGLAHVRCASRDEPARIHSATRRYLRGRLSRTALRRTVVPRPIVREVGQLASVVLTTVAEREVASRRFLRLVTG